jgi:uncharacterized protein (TIGR02270 family)
MSAEWETLCFIIKKILWASEARTMQTHILSAKAAAAYRDIYEEFFEEASFLWILRSVTLSKPHYTLADIKDLEERIHHHLNGLRTSPDIAWQICLENMETVDPGEIFTTAVIAIESQDIRRIQQITEQGCSDDEARQGLVSALGWLPDNVVDPLIWHLFSSGKANHAYLTAAACSVRRMDPKNYLEQLLARDGCSEDELLYARCLRLIGELKRTDLAGELAAGMESGSDSVAFWSTWSSLLLGERNNAHRLMPFALNPGPYREKAIDILIRVLPLGYARKTIAKLAESPDNLRTAIKAAAIAGDPALIPWLLKNMADPKLARLAAESFCTITGLDLEIHHLVSEAPENVGASADDDNEDEDVSASEDDNLPWPDVARLRSIWKEKGDYFRKGQRYFMKMPITAENLQKQIVVAGQRRRKLAAMELALTAADAPFLNINSRIPA